jgi:hypothetical protein
MKGLWDAEGRPHKKTIVRAQCTVMFILIVVLGLSSSLQAAEENTPELPPFEVKPHLQLLDLTMPTPVKVVVPRLRNNLRGTEVRLTFYVGTDGEAYSINYDGSPFDDRRNQVGEAMRRMVKYWEFEPAMDKQGRAIVVKVALPVRVVAPGTGNAETYASLTLDSPVLLAVLDKK